MTGYSLPRCPASFNMARYCIGAPAARLPGKMALRVYDQPSAEAVTEHMTFAELERAVLRLSAGLSAAGLKQGDCIAIHLGNSSRSALLFFAAIARGFIALPLSDQLTARELHLLLEDSGARVIATASADLAADTIPPAVRALSATDIESMLRHPVAATYADTNADDPAFLIYTSGTTAQPKGVLHGHRSAWGRRPMYRGWYGLSEADAMLHAGAFNWTYTLGVGLTDPWANGAAALIYAGDKKPELWPSIIARTGATLFAAVPGVYRQILKYAQPAPEQFGALRHGLVAGESVPAELFDTWLKQTGRPLYEALGMSEISTYISSGPDVPRRPGAVGKAQAGRAVAILPAAGGETPLPPGQDGLIAVHRSDPGLMLGYWRRAEEEAAVMRGDWFTGGDLGRMDADGYITHLGRANELMNAGGYRVSPLEVEAVLAAAPGVSEVACAEIKVAHDISVVGAFIVTQPGAPEDASAINQYAHDNLAAYKCPRHIVFLPSLPRTANGKVQRSALPALAPRLT